MKNIVQMTLGITSSLVIAASCGCQFANNLLGRAPRDVLEEYDSPEGDGYLEQGPVIRGQYLAQPDPSPTATERALELFAEVEQLRDLTRNQELEIDSLHAELADNRNALDRAEGELEQANGDLQRAQTSIETWRADVDMLRRKMQLREQSQIQALDEILDLLQDSQHASTPASSAVLNSRIRVLEEAFAPQNDSYR